MTTVTAVTAVLVLRHGETTWNAEGRWQGWADSPLSPRGEEQALDAAAHLGSYGFNAVVSSDLSRATRTAEMIADALGLGAVTIDERLRERHVGSFEGLTREEIAERFPDARDLRSLRLIAPDMETDETVLHRVDAALTDIARQHPDETVLALSHGGVLRLLDERVHGGRAVAPPNLGGRWMTVAAEGGAIVLGELHVPIEPDLVTTPTAE